MSLFDDLPEVDRLKAELVAAGKREAALKQGHRAEAVALQEVQSLREQLRAARDQIDTLKREMVAQRDAEFNRGYLIACCAIQDLHGEKDIVADVLAERQISQDEVNGMDLCECDAEMLAEIRASRDTDPIISAPPQAPSPSPEMISPSGIAF